MQGETTKKVVTQLTTSGVAGRACALLVDDHYRHHALGHR